MIKATWEQQMTNSPYNFKQTENQRWGIYINDRLLATVGSYEVCMSIGKSLDGSLSREDSLKAKMTFKNSIDRSLIIR